ncbi:acyl-CoA dehydrogenase family protein [Paractinoplanes rishiriensis]|uniref:Acyl-CoA dehydrogenase n=1 Tax=Paractinoplanes rishiriensis TaxID=1050105 RepID=A0A919JWB6_9ACTN|nr:acyl-CoA dehydrogenase family protein [Actinoplanes rishiriensis]GIE94323.1 acyl-CoA dehydrogenase [Actinoplanes rishiriensis]
MTTAAETAAGPDFRLDEAQDTIARLAAEVLSGAAGQHLDGQPDRAWTALGQAGLLTLAVPEGLGGEGLGPAETALVLTEIGRRALPLPALSTLALGVLPIARWGTPDQQRDLLADLVEATPSAAEPGGGGAVAGRVLTAAVAEPGAPMPAHPTATATRDWRITGHVTGAPDAERAHRILIPVRTAGDGLAVVVVDLAAPGVTVRPGSVRLDAAEAEPLGGDTTGRAVADLYRFATLGACALGDGALAGALDLTAGHVRTREQFGRPLATFQAVAQQIADVYVTARTLHLAVQAASWALGAGRDADADLAVAAQWFTAEAPPAVRTCHHLHGGLGLTADYPLHRHSSLIRDLVRFLGGSEHCLQRLGGHVVHRSH